MITAISTTYASYAVAGPGNPGAQAANADIRGRELQRSAPADNTATQPTSRQNTDSDAGAVELRGSQRVGAAQHGSDVERQLVDQLAARDREVRAHEQAHQAAGGDLAGSVSYTYQVGPDGKRYAVGGEVGIQAPVASGDPEADLEKAQTILRAAMAPAEPSGQDLRVAASARAMAASASAALVAERAASESAAPEQRRQQKSTEEPVDSRPDVAVAQPNEADRPVQASSDAGNDSLSVVDRYEQTRSEREQNRAEFEAQQAAQEQRSEYMAEYRQEMEQVQQRLAEVNRMLVQTGVVDTGSLVGSMINDQA